MTTPLYAYVSNNCTDCFLFRNAATRMFPFGPFLGEYFCDLLRFISILAVDVILILKSKIDNSQGSIGAMGKVLLKIR